MAHTTHLSNGWVAIHDGDPSDVLFRKIEDGKVIVYNSQYDRDYEGDTIVPYYIMQEFVVEQLRKNLIEKIETMGDDDLIARMIS